MKVALINILFIFMTLSGLLAQQPEYLYVGNTQTSVYSINTSTGALTQIAGSPFSLGGTAIAFHPNGQFAYFASNSGNGLIAATIDANGALREIPGSPYFAGASPIATAIDPSGHYAYVAVQPKDGSEGVYPFTIDGDTGALTPAGAPAMLTAVSMIVDSSGKFLFTASGTGVFVFSINPKNGELTQVTQEPLFCYTVSLDSAIETLYAECSGQIEAYSVDENTGSLAVVPGSPFAVPSTALDGPIIDRTGRFFYSVANGKIFGFLINPNTGALELPLIGSPFHVKATVGGIDDTNHFFYTTDQTESTLLGFSISKASGTIETLPGSPFPGSAEPLFTSVAPTLKISQATLISLAIKPADPQSIFTPGGTLQFTAFGTYNDGTTRYLTASATWTSSDNTVATISNTPGSQGLATLLGTGQSTISATLGGVSATTTLTSNPLTVVSIALSPASPVVVAGTAFQMTATGTFNNGTNQNLTDTAAWTSSNVAVATVNAKGIVKGIAAGAAVITATSGSVSGSSTLTVNP